MGDHAGASITLQEFHGDVAKFRDWRRHVNIFHASQPEDKRCLTAAFILGCLRGEAYEACRHFDPESLRSKGEAGLQELLNFLESRFGWQPESLLYEGLE